VFFTRAVGLACRLCGIVAPGNREQVIELVQPFARRTPEVISEMANAMLVQREIALGNVGSNQNAIVGLVKVMAPRLPAVMADHLMLPCAAALLDAAFDAISEDNGLPIEPTALLVQSLFVLLRGYETVQCLHTRAPERAAHLNAVEFADGCAALACTKPVTAIASPCNFRIWPNHARRAAFLAYAMVALGAISDGCDVILERARAAHAAGPYQSDGFRTPEDGEIFDVGRLYIIRETACIAPRGAIVSRLDAVKARRGQCIP